MLQSGNCVRLVAVQPCPATAGNRPARPTAESGVKQTFSFEGKSVEKVMGSITQYSEQLDSAAQLKEAGLDKVVIESEC